MRRSAHPIEKVWTALTDREHLAAWLMRNDFEPRVGKAFTLHGVPMPGWRGWENCEVLELKAPRRMVWS
ncbi:MAG TPA: SRPBCC domain-containing protein [Alphaproteobacteria bacterium]|nr:SRPBCC domain-containing protein [Alphaproteobacteria bacterium]